MTLAEIVRNMVASGCTIQQLADFVIRWDEGRRERVRATNTDRQREWREKARNVCHDVTVRDNTCHSVTDRDESDTGLARAPALVSELDINIPPSDTTYPQPPKPASKPAAEKRARRLPEDFQPDEADFAVGLECGFSHQDVTGWIRTEFCDYWHAEGGQKARKLDWHKTFRNRIRDLSHRKRPNGRAGPIPTRRNPSLEAYEILTREDHERRDQSRKSEDSCAVSALSIFDDCA